ncbi:MAG: Uma2 family endonuclease [Pirellulales bacterium]|nr:Uma2 family endonuclease [Pirellulales bacterium]
MSKTANLITADELLRMPDVGWRYELLQGELRKMAPAGHEHGGSAHDFALVLGNFVKQYKLGKVYAAETGFLLSKNPDTVLAPDCAFVRKERLAKANKVSGYFPGPPDLAVEVVSPSDRPAEVRQKALAWLAAVTLAVVVIDPAPHTMTVYRAPDNVVNLQESDVLDLSDVVQDFLMPVSELFDVT